MTNYRNFEQHLAVDGSPKRILSLDGGGLRGMMTLQVLHRIESLLRQRFNDPELCLGDYFDLIAGTSTGAIIAAGLSLGMTVGQIEDHYRALGNKVFMRSFWRRGLLQDSYDASAVAEALRGVYGPGGLNRTDFRTGLLVVAKRLDTGSTWVLTNNTKAKYFLPNPDRAETIPNGEYPLWQVVRASTAAPTFFAPEKIRIHSNQNPARKDIEGFFVDGGCSPHNNPSLQALMAATMEGYRFNWPAGDKNLLLVSVGTGKADPRVDTGGKFAGLAAAQGLLALKNLMEDCSDLVETLLQWLSVPTPTSREIDREMGHAGPVPGGHALLTYHRYNALFTAEWFKSALGRDVDAAHLDTMQEMDRPENLDALCELGKVVAAQVKPEHLPEHFDKGVRMG
ncbi:Patatin-like phospholipase [Azotobacter beijerinckii]|uniref:Patatin-like phospholipase n=1 Tax=Azotobacter beijerinckii TaxID=170623 RepID=A0A1H9PV47_9GAMM|nr:patatin-like phospholipase family protein [Azotobacter beijerinckii]SER52156.1 Patatin-like phospholipase [Azotobacter beijerinckii]